MLSAVLSRVRATPSRLQALRDSPRQARLDAVTLLVIGLAMLLVDVEMLGSDVPAVDAPGGPLPWQVGLLVAATTALLLKRRWPTAVLVAVTVLTLADAALGGSLGMYLVLFDAIFTVAPCFCKSS